MGEVQIDGGADLPQPTAFGREMRKLFLFDDKYVNLNHGSFGAFPRSIRDLVQRYQAQTESRPDPFLRYDYPKLLDRSRESLSKFLHAPLDEVVLLSNATTGVNTVLRSLVFQPGDHILYFNTTYGACAKTVEYVCEYTPAKPIRLDLSLPIEDDAIVGMMREAIRAVKEEGGRVKVAILDTVVSMPGVKMPLESMVKVCKDEDVLSLVDGAHGIGHLELDLAKLDADFFISNCHK
ncbi:MAG: hypothetical protein M1837_002310 [Sclerophora amabilis]|nr:MAG: hypothetical protein M1837_002310 [Sclerophora amabilis]